MSNPFLFEPPTNDFAEAIGPPCAKVDGDIRLQGKGIDGTSDAFSIVIEGDGA